MSTAICRIPSANGSAAKHAAIATHENTTMPRCAPLRSASQPQPAGAKARATCGSASTSAISAAPSPRQASQSGKYATYAAE